MYQIRSGCEGRGELGMLRVLDVERRDSEEVSAAQQCNWQTLKPGR